MTNKCAFVWVVLDPLGTIIFGKSLTCKPYEAKTHMHEEACRDFFRMCRQQAVFMRTNGPPWWNTVFSFSFFSKIHWPRPNLPNFSVLWIYLKRKWVFLDTASKTLEKISSNRKNTLITCVQATSKFYDVKLCPMLHEKLFLKRHTHTHTHTQTHTHTHTHTHTQRE